MALTIKSGSTDQSVYFFVPDSPSSTGAGLSGLVFNSAGLIAYYNKEGGASTQITLATLASASAAHADGGFIEVDATNMKGIYRLDLPDAAVSSGIETIVMLSGAANMAPVTKEIQLVAYDPQSATNLGLSTVAAIETDTVDIQSRLPAALVSGRMDSSVGAMATDVLTSGALAASAVTEIQTGLATSASITTLTTNVASVKTDTGTNIPAQLTTIAGYLDTEIVAIKAKTDNLPSDPASASVIAASFTATNALIPSANANADAVLDRANGVETGLTLRQSMRLMLSSMAGKLSGAATTTVTIRNAVDTKDRIIATVDASGNRSALTLDVS